MIKKPPKPSIGESKLKKPTPTPTSKRAAQRRRASFGLTQSEKDLAYLDRHLPRHAKNAVEVVLIARALQRIKTGKQYRKHGYRTFTALCRDRFDFSDGWGYELVQVAEHIPMDKVRGKHFYCTALVLIATEPIERYADLLLEHGAGRTVAVLKEAQREAHRYNDEEQGAQALLAVLGKSNKPGTLHDKPSARPRPKGRVPPADHIQ